jgi:hypothetical protein
MGSTNPMRGSKEAEHNSLRFSGYPTGTVGYGPPQPQYYQPS